MLYENVLQETKYQNTMTWR